MLRITTKKYLMECFLRVLKVSLALKVKQENRDRKEKQDPLDLRALLEKQGLRYMSGLKKIVC